MPTTPSDDLTDELRRAFAMSVEELTVSHELTTRVHDARHRARRRAAAVRIGTPLSVLAAGAIALSLSGSPDGTAPPNAVDSRASDVTFRLVSVDVPEGSTTKLQKECLVAGEKGFTAPMTDGKLSLDAATGGCLGVLLRTASSEVSHNNIRVSVTRNPQARTLTVDLARSTHLERTILSVVITDVGRDQQMTADLRNDDLVLRRS